MYWCHVDKPILHDHHVLLSVACFVIVSLKSLYFWQISVIEKQRVFLFWFFSETTNKKLWTLTSIRACAFRDWDRNITVNCMWISKSGRIFCILTHILVTIANLVKFIVIIKRDIIMLLLFVTVITVIPLNSHQLK